MPRPSTRRGDAPELRTFDLTRLDDWLPTFDHAVAITASSAVMVSQTGPYVEPQRVGRPFDCAPDHVTLRLADTTAATLRVWTGDPANDAPASLEVRGRDDTMLHRGFLSTTDELRRIRRYAADDRTDRPAPVEEPRRSPRRSLMTRLVGGSTTDHVDTMIRDGGRSRRQALPVLGLGMTQRVEPVMGLHALVHLRAMQVDLTVAVPTTGLLHAVRGPIDSLYQVGAKVSLGIGSATTTIDTAAVAECWVTRPETGPAMLELYDRHGACVVVFTRTGDPSPVDAARWDHVLAMTCLS